jgi:hypothetical protein
LAWMCHVQIIRFAQSRVGFTTLPHNDSPRPRKTLRICNAALSSTRHFLHPATSEAENCPEVVTCKVERHLYSSTFVPNGNVLAVKLHQSDPWDAVAFKRYMHWNANETTVQPPVFGYRYRPECPQRLIIGIKIVVRQAQQCFTESAIHEFNKHICHGSFHI